HSRQGFSVGRKCNRADDIRVSLQFRALFAANRVPKSCAPVIACRRQRLSIRRIGNCPNISNMPRQTENFAVRHLLEVMPLEPAQVLVARLWPQTVQQFFYPLHITFFENLLSQVDSRRIQPLPALPCKGLRPSAFLYLQHRVALCTLPF